MALIRTLDPVGPVERTTLIQDAGNLFEAAGRHPAALGEVDICSLLPGTIVIVETANSRYEIVLQEEPGVAMMQGGAALAAAARVRIVGSIGSGVGRVLGAIIVGLRLEVVTDGKRVLTSRVRRITVTPSEVDR
jgi:hypothetical protein